MERKWIAPAAGLFSLWLIATLAFGGVAPPFERVYLICAFLVAVATLAKSDAWRTSGGEYPPSFISAAASLVLLFLGVIFFQLIHWNEIILRILAPFTAQLTFGTLRELALLSPGDRFPISLDPVATRLALGQMVATLLSLLSAFLLFRHRTIRSSFAFALIFGSAFIAFFGLIHRFSGSTQIYWIFDRGWLYFGPYVNKNHAGALFAAASALALGLISRERDRTNRIAFSVALGILLLGLLFTGSRAAVVAVVGAFVMRMVLWRDTQSSSRKSSRYAWATLILVGGIAFYWQASFFSRIVQSATALQPELRRRFWSEAISLGRENLLFGIGFGAFGRLSQWFSATLHWVRPEHVENDYIELFASSGFLGGLIGFVLLGGLLWTIVQILRDRSTSLTKKSFGLALMALGINSFFIFNAPLPAHQILFAILVGGLLASHESSIFRSPIVRFGTLLLLVLAIPLGFSTKAFHRVDEKLPKEFELPINRQAHDLLSSEEAVHADPIDAHSLYVLARRSAELKDIHRSTFALRVAERLDPFLLSDRAIAAQALASESPLDGHDFLVRLADTTAPINSLQRGTFMIEAAAASARTANWPAFRNELQRAKELSPDDWRIPLLDAIIQEPIAPQLLESWNRTKRQNINPSNWDRWLGLLKFRERPVDAVEIAAALAPARPDLGLFLVHLGRMFPSSEPIEVALDSNRPSPRFQANGAASASANWLTPKDSVEIPERIEVRARAAHQEIDTFLLPVDILLEPSALSLRFMIHVEGRSATPPKVLLQADSKIHLLDIPPRKIAPGEYEYLVRRLGELEWVTKSPSRKITGIGFTPLERDGIYAPGPMKIFVDSGR